MCSRAPLWDFSYPVAVVSQQQSLQASILLSSILTVSCISSAAAASEGSRLALHAHGTDSQHQVSARAPPLVVLTLRSIGSRWHFWLCIVPWLFWIKSERAFPLLTGPLLVPLPGRRRLRVGSCILGRHRPFWGIHCVNFFDLTSFVVSLTNNTVPTFGHFMHSAAAKAQGPDAPYYFQTNCRMRHGLLPILTHLEAVCYENTALDLIQPAWGWTHQDQEHSCRALHQGRAAAPPTFAKGA
eukprot:scaffold185347_cov45-Prasinocladus_malaysianus.AAC.1